MATGEDAKSGQGRAAPAVPVVGKLSPGQAKYQRRGFCGPFLGLTHEETALALAAYKRCRKDTAAKSYSMFHTDHPWLCRIAKHPWILDAVAVALGTSDIYLISSHLFAREPGQSLHSEAGLDWHKDGEQYLRRLSPVDSAHFVTAFLALSPCDVSHGCLCARPLCGGEEEFVELLPGEFSLHGPFTEHTGVRNVSGEVRYCIALRYVAASTRCLDGPKPALLVRGSDPNGHFEPLPEPAREGDVRGAARRSAILEAWAQSIGDYGWGSDPESAPAEALQLWEVVGTRVTVREAPHTAAAAFGELGHGDAVFVGLQHGDWLRIDVHGRRRDEAEAPLPQRWALARRTRPTPLELLRRVW